MQSCLAKKRAFDNSLRKHFCHWLLSNASRVVSILPASLGFGGGVIVFNTTKCTKHEHSQYVVLKTITLPSGSGDVGKILMGFFQQLNPA